MKNRIVISYDETHHLKSGKPLYSQRFDKVQSYHFPPAYAPVIKNHEAFFIDIHGNQVFQRKFKDVFGFYDGVATVADKSGFFHINAQGLDIHSQIYSWAGNFQEGFCTVQSIDGGLFYHIDETGKPIYNQKYAYVGDYRYGVAVVSDDNGNCTHINSEGNLLHGKYFLELDVYHKGYAIAKDERGYFHINKKGEPLYHNRYIHLEPFYNGRAIAVNQCGVRSIIAIDGITIKNIHNQSTETSAIDNKTYSFEE